LGVGAGGQAYGARLAEVKCVLDIVTKEAWTQTINIPLAFAGPPLKDEGVNLIKLVMNGSKWATESEPHQKLMFWSPDRMFDWVKNKISKAHVEKQFTVSHMGKSQGVVFDKSYLPAPGGPIWQQHLDPSIKKK